MVPWHVPLQSTLPIGNCISLATRREKRGFFEFLASTAYNGWCSEIIRSGLTRRRKRSTARVSGSDRGRGPDS